MALLLGKTVAELTRELSAREFMSWIAYLELDPPTKRDDEHTAMLCATVAQCAGNKVTMEDFLPGGRKPQSIDDQIAILKAADTSGS